MNRIDTLSLTPEALARLSTQNRVDSYNAIAGPDDGTGVDCPLCRNRGAVAFLDEVSGNLTIRDCRCQAARRTILRLKRQGLHRQTRQCTFEAFQTDTEARAVMKRTVEAFTKTPDGNWLMLCGQSGAGKTHLCTAAFVQLSFQRGMEGHYFLWNADGRQLKAASMDDPSGLWDRFKRCELLYIDDLFKGKSGQEPTDADIRLAFELLDYRYGNRLTTILSSEMEFEQLMRVDEAVAGRIRQMCGPYLVNISKSPDKNFRF